MSEAWGGVPMVKHTYVDPEEDIGGTRRDGPLRRDGLDADPDGGEERSAGAGGTEVGVCGGGEGDADEDDCDCAKRVERGGWRRGGAGWRREGWRRGGANRLETPNIGVVKDAEKWVSGSNGWKTPSKGGK